MRGTWREDFITWDPERYVEKAPETDISIHRGPDGKSGRGLVYWGR